ncbi:MAG: hypothetical protein ACTHK6_04930 [Solirubrobacterales bacterium]
MTFPKAPCEEAGIVAGDRLRVQVDGPGRIVFEKIDATEGLGEETPA